MNLILSAIFFLHPIIQESIPEGTFTYPGFHPREIILVEPERSPLLEKAYHEIESKLKETSSEQEILEITSRYVREVLFDLNFCNERKVSSLIQTLYPDESEPEISIETFLEQKTGVCRHIALTSTYLVNRLIKAGWLKGEALLIRENCPTGRHAWTLFLSNDGAWHLDSLWGVLENGKNSAGFSELCNKYGKRTMNDQKKRWETAP